MTSHVRLKPLVLLFYLFCTYSKWRWRHHRACNDFYPTTQVFNVLLYYFVSNFIKVKSYQPMWTRSSPPHPCSRHPCISTTLTVPRSDHCYKNLGQSCAHYFDVAPLPCSTFQTNNFPRLALTRPWCYCVGVNKCCFMFLMFLSVKELLSYTIISPFTWLARASCVSVSRFRVVTSTHSLVQPQRSCTRGKALKIH